MRVLLQLTMQRRPRPPTSQIDTSMPVVCDPDVLTVSILCSVDLGAIDPYFVAYFEMRQRLVWSLPAGSCAGYGTMELLSGSTYGRIECSIIGGLGSSKVQG